MSEQSADRVALGELAHAREVLGVDRDAPRDVIRAAYRKALFAAHPDHGGSAHRARQVIDAAELLGRPRPHDDSTVTEPALDPGLSELVWRVDDDTIAVALSAEDTYLKLLEVAHRIGTVTYVDRQCGVLESLLKTKEGTTVSMLVTLQGRSNATTEVFFALEPIDAIRGELPTVFDVSELVAAMFSKFG
jgi:hypothetical protein